MGPVTSYFGRVPVIFCIKKTKM